MTAPQAREFESLRQWVKDHAKFGPLTETDITSIAELIDEFQKLAAAPAAPLPINVTERYKFIIETFRNHMTEEDFKKAMQELVNKKGE